MGEIIPSADCLIVKLYVVKYTVDHPELFGLSESSILLVQNFLKRKRANQS